MIRITDSVCHRSASSPCPRGWSRCYTRRVGELRLPRQIESDRQCAAIRRVLAARPRKLWRGGVVEVPVLELTDALAAALRTARARGQLERGLEAAVAALEAERRGLAAIEQREGRGGSGRISRLCAVASDGAERFYRRVERCLAAHTPRVLGCLLEVDSLTLGRRLYDRETPVKLVLAAHKDGVAAILRSVARR
jgi:hypothetical protein